MNHSLLRIAIACSAFAAPALSQDVVAIKAKTIHTITGPSIQDGTILLQNGRIQKIAKTSEVEIPWSAKVIDASDKVVMPTYVLAHSNGGMRGANESMQNVPWLSVADAIDPASTYFEGMLRNGVGTIHVLPGNNTLMAGSGMVVRPFGRTVEDMTVAANTGMKLSLATSGSSRLQKIREMRRAIAAVREYLANYEREKAEFEKEKAAGAIPADKKWEKEIDRKQKNAVELIEKKLKGWLYVPSFAELDEALRMSKDLDLNLVLGPNLDEAMALLTKLKQPVVLDSTIEYYETDPETRKEEQYCSARMLADAGVPFALSLGNSGASSYPWWQIGTCMRNGLTKQQALEALTMVPAKMLGLQDQVGSLQVGKLGNVQILSGDPTSATTWVETVVLEGEVVYERSKDPRLKYLFEAAEKAAEPAPAGDNNKQGEGR